MALQRKTSRDLLLLLAAVLAIPSGTTLAADTVRDVTDTEIIIGIMTDISGVTAVQVVKNGWPQWQRCAGEMLTAETNRSPALAD
jgi:hypothetical protein